MKSSRVITAIAASACSLLLISGCGDDGDQTKKTPDKVEFSKTDDKMNRDLINVLRTRHEVGANIIVRPARVFINVAKGGVGHESVRFVNEGDKVATIQGIIQTRPDDGLWFEEYGNCFSGMSLSPGDSCDLIVAYRDRSGQPYENEIFVKVQSSPNLTPEIRIAIKADLWIPPEKWVDPLNEDNYRKNKLSGLGQTGNLGIEQGAGSAGDQRLVDKIINNGTDGIGRDGLGRSGSAGQQDSSTDGTGVVGLAGAGGKGGAGIAGGTAKDRNSEETIRNGALGSGSLGAGGRDTEKSSTTIRETHNGAAGASTIQQTSSSKDGGDKSTSGRDDSSKAGAGSDKSMSGRDDSSKAGAGSDKSTSGRDDSSEAGTGSDKSTSGRDDSSKAGAGSDKLTSGRDDSSKAGAGSDKSTSGRDDSSKAGTGSDKSTSGRDDSSKAGTGSDKSTSGRDDSSEAGTGSDKSTSGRDGSSKAGTGSDKSATGRDGNSSKDDVGSGGRVVMGGTGSGHDGSDGGGTGRDGEGGRGYVGQGEAGQGADGWDAAAGQDPNVGLIPGEGGQEAADRAIMRQAMEAADARRRAGFGEASRNEMGIGGGPKKSTKYTDLRYDKDKFAWTESSLPVDRRNILTNDRVVKAVLETSFTNIACDQVVAVAEGDTYSPDHSNILIPVGTRFVGKCSGFADERALIQWVRFITPNGVSARIQSTAADPTGRGGIPGRLDRRWWERFGMPLVFSALKAAGRYLMGEDENVTVNVDNGVTVKGNSAKNDAIEKFGEETEKTLDKLFEEIMDVRQVLTVPGGTKVDIVFAEDIYFKTPQEVVSLNGVEYEIRRSEETQKIEPATTGDLRAYPEGMLDEDGATKEMTIQMQGRTYKLVPDTLKAAIKSSISTQGGVTQSGGAQNSIGTPRRP